MKTRIALMAAFAAVSLFVASGCAEKTAKVTETPGDKPAVAEAAKQPAEVQKPKVAEETVKPSEAPVSKPAETAKAEPPVTKPKETAVTAGTAGSKSNDLKTIHFDYDKSNITEENRVLLDKNYDYLAKTSSAKVTIVGHCDERGTAQYNMALGDRRANSAKNYLVNRGIDAKRLDTLSKGKEEPVDPGHNEEAWKKNRRDEFNIMN